MNETTKIYSKVACGVFLITLAAGCPLPDNPVTSPSLQGQQIEAYIDAGSTAFGTDGGAGSPELGDPTDAGMSLISNEDAGQSLDPTLTDGGVAVGGTDGGFVWDAGQSGTDSFACFAHEDCPAEQPVCDAESGYCEPCAVECGPNENCEVTDASETCVCQPDYTPNADLDCVLKCDSNDACQDALNPICDATTGLCRPCSIGECLVAGASVCNEQTGACWDPCAEQTCDISANNFCVIAIDGSGGTCECVSGASPASNGSGECLFDNQCINNDDCTLPELPVCNEQGGCSNRATPRFAT